ncbi:hypothetical protein [Terribacillus sp. DMT04]|uniref:hypothetical protein n=1 Tax=Terribacillus sp. DMT04 TaxID=2850441 RepID=UPI001C2C6A91|nr:hypothetical protein [Terribacillus sp. DMT04]QXE02277.1 hypothetical protein KS242_03325 [Terribacillus sp. DMT04]
MRDGYKLFMNKFNIDEEDPIKFEIDETIYVIDPVVKDEWELLKSNIYNGNQKVFVRGYGRDAEGTELYMSLYKELFGHNNFFKDATNNAEPTKLIRRLTGYSRQEKPTTKYKRLRNYQVSHIFGKTKNPFAFTAPWNIVYVPKIMDPFTGHESKGILTERFQKDFLTHFYNYYKDYIEEFNNIMFELSPQVDKYLEENADFITEKFKSDAIEQFSPITKWSELGEILI